MTEMQEKRYVAVICEYNPFHFGHLHQINRLKEEFDGVVCIIMGARVSSAAAMIAIAISRFSKLNAPTAYLPACASFSIFSDVTYIFFFLSEFIFLFLFCFLFSVFDSLFISYALSAQDDRGGVSVPFAKGGRPRRLETDSRGRLSLQFWRFLGL